MKKILSMGLLIVSMLLVIGISYANAEDPGFNVPSGGLPDPGDEASDLPANLVTTALSWFFVIAGIICIVVMVWAGITYATAGGDEEKVGKAKTRLIYGIIGIAVIIAAYAITQIIKDAISDGNINIPTPNVQ